MLTKRQANSLKAAELPSLGSWFAIRVATSVIREKLPMALYRADTSGKPRWNRKKSLVRPARFASAYTRRSRSASPFGSKTMTTSPRRMSWVIRISASRVLPTRVVPSTRVWPTRSPRSIQTSCSSGSTACSAGVPPTAGRGLSGFHHRGWRRSQAKRLSIGIDSHATSFCRAHWYSAPGCT